MKYAPDYSSRFRILKGGKVSMVVSAMLMSAGIVTSASAAVGDIVIDNTTFKDGNDNFMYSVDGTSQLSWSSNSITFNYATVYHPAGWNPSSDPMTSIIVDGTNGQTINLGNALNNHFSLTGSGRLLFLRSTVTDTTINNYGNIATTTYSSNATMQFNNSNFNNTINNYGTISAADELDNNGNVNFSGFAIENYLSGLTLNNYGTINGRIYSTNGGGTIINSENATINGRIYTRGTLQNSGLVNLKPEVYNWGTVGYSYQSDIASFTNNATGTLQINLDTDGSLSGTHYTNLSTTNATFASGSTIKVYVSDASTNVGLLAGTTLTDVVLSNGTLTVDGTLHIDDNSALLNFEYIINGVGSAAGDNTIDLRAVKASTILDETQLGGGNSPAKNAARVLDTASDNGQMGSFITYLNNLGNSGEVAAAVASTTPAASVSSLDSAMQTLNTVGTIVNQRAVTRAGNRTMNRGGNSGDEMMTEKNLWVKPFFSTGKQDNKDGINGYDVKTRGIGMGADAEISAGNMAGLGLFYTKGDLDVNNMDQSSDMDAYTALVYGSTSLMEGKAEFLYQLGHTWQKTDSHRVDGTGNANADFTTKVAFLDLKLQRDYEIDKSLIVTPVLSTTYRHIDMPAYTESGTSSALGSIEASTSTQLIAMAGATVQKYLDNSSKVIAEFNLGYDFHHDKESVTASYVGAPGVSYQYEGIDNGGVVYNAGLGYETAVAGNQSVNFMYNLEGEGSSFQNHMFSMNYNIKF